MTTPIVFTPPLDPYHRPARELAGYVEINIDDGDEVLPPQLPLSPWESITLLTVPPGQGYTLREQPVAIKDYTELNKTHFDASPYNAARIVVNVKRAGVSTSRLKLRYSTTGQAGTFVDAGATIAGASAELAVKMNQVGVRIGAAPLIAGATAVDGVYWEVVSVGGDGVVSPMIGNVEIQFLRKTFRECTWTPIVGPDDFVDNGASMPGDLDWTHVGAVDGFVTGCIAPSCVAMIAIFRFGSGAVLNHYRHRQFSVGDFPELTEGREVRLTGEMSWTYAHLACGEPANPNVRVTLAVNGVVFTNVPSGFPPYDTAWLPFEIILPADGSGVDVAVGIFGDSGNCSLSLIGAFRNFELSVRDGTPGEDCI